MKYLLSILLFTFSLPFTWCQSYLKAEGKQIVNEDNESIILRGMGLGGWMVQEGYMLQTAEFASPQHQIKERITEIIGEEATAEFYEAWLENYMQKVDVDSLKSWGFNSVRLPMHYNLYTLPIEDEPIPGKNTWLEKGFQLTDSLISWCAQNEMYVVLDLHAAPGGQGYDEGISDYDPDKDSFWENVENRNKAASLWKRLAARYVDEPWVAGYDLLNEPNWNLPGGSLLRSAYIQMTDSIREVDAKHIIFIEGNWFANDFTGLTPPWDNNMVYSPHKYWSINDQASIQWVLDLREEQNVPLYLGESGENSNQWFHDAIKLFEDNDIGWAWWPLKKVEAIAGPLSVNKTFGYEALLNYWKGTGNMPTKESATLALMQLAENYKMENCEFESGVIDAMFRQVQTNETKAFRKHNIPGKINAVDYDLGKNQFAYKDNDYATFHVSTGTFTAWNNGWSFRNDGVDIEPTEDNENSSGFNVGWTNENEWMKYSLDQVESGVYKIVLRIAGGDFGGKMHFSANDVDISMEQFVPFTGGYQDWDNLEIEDVVIYDDFDQIKFHIDGAGFNISSYEFIKTGEIEDVEALFVSGITEDKNNVSVFTNKQLDINSEINISDFSLLVNGQNYTVTDVEIDPVDTRIIHYTVGQDLIFTDIIKASYNGNSIQSIDDDFLGAFAQKDITNNLPTFLIIPSKIEAENYINESGITLETSTDLGGGQNIGYLDVGDFCEYDVLVQYGGAYEINYRNASDGHIGGLKLEFENEVGEVTEIHSIEFSSTGGWQTWQDSKFDVYIPEGRYTMRLIITKSQFNLNWMDFKLISPVKNEENLTVQVFPNPTMQTCYIDDSKSESEISNYTLSDLQGQIISQGKLADNRINLSNYESGVYFLRLKAKNGLEIVEKIIKL